MKAKKLTVLAVLVILLAGAVVLKAVGTRKQGAVLEKAVASSIVAVLPSDVVPVQVSRIEILTGDKTDGGVVLEKKSDGEWVIPSHFGTRGAKWSIDDLLKSVSGLKGELRSESPGVLGDFEIDDARAISVRFFAADQSEVAHLLVSPLRPFGIQNFVRVAGSNRVYVTQTDVLGALGIYEKGAAPDYRVFAHQQTLKFDISSVVKFLLTQPNGSALTLVKKEKAEDKTIYWEFDPADSSEVDPAKASEWLSSAVNFYGQGAVDPAGDHGFGAKPFLTIWHGDAANPSAIELYTGKPGEDKMLVVKTTPDNLAWQIPSDALDRLKKEKSFFLKAKPAA